MPGCNKLYKCGSQKIRKQCTFVAGRLKTAVLLQKPWFTAFLSRMSRKTQHTRFEDRILRKLANEDKPQIVPPCHMVKCNNLVHCIFPKDVRKVGQMVTIADTLRKSFRGKFETYLRSKLKVVTKLIISFGTHFLPFHTCVHLLTPVRIKL